jgi:hypothetical protein
LNGHGQSDIVEERRNYKAALAFQQTLEQIPLSMARFTSAKAPIAER